MQLHISLAIKNIRPRKSNKILLFEHLWYVTKEVGGVLSNIYAIKI